MPIIAALDYTISLAASRLLAALFCLAGRVLGSMTEPSAPECPVRGGPPACVAQVRSTRLMIRIAVRMPAMLSNQA